MSNNSFIVASKTGDMISIREFIHMGVDVNIKDEKGYTALIYASIYGHLDICKVLIEKGANINVQTPHGLSCMHLAVKNNHIGVCQELINYGINLNLKTKDCFGSRSCLYYGIKKNNVEICRLLIEYGIDLETTYLHMTLKRRLDGLSEQIFEKNGDFNNSLRICFGFYLGKSKLYTKSQKSGPDSYLKLCEKLLQYGADVNTPVFPNDSYYKPIAYAIQNNDRGLFKLLIKYDSVVDFNNPTSTKRAYDKYYFIRQYESMLCGYDI